MQDNMLFSGEIYTTGKNFTLLSVVPVVKNLISVRDFIGRQNCQFCLFPIFPPESREHKASLPAFLDTAAHTDFPSIELEQVSHEKVRPEWIVVAAENIVLEVIRALVVFLTLACFHQAFGGSYFSVLAKRKEHLSQSLKFWIRSEELCQFSVAR